MGNKSLEAVAREYSYGVYGDLAKIMIRVTPLGDVRHSHLGSTVR